MMDGAQEVAALQTFGIRPETAASAVALPGEVFSSNVVADLTGLEADYRTPPLSAEEAVSRLADSYTVPGRPESAEYARRVLIVIRAAEAIGCAVVPGEAAGGQA